MASNFPRPRGRDSALSSLVVVIKAVDIAKDVCGIPPAQAALASVSALLTMIRDYMANEQDYVDLGLSCADVCKVLGRGLRGRRLSELNPSVLEAIEELTTTVAAIQKGVVKQEKRNAASRLLHAKNDKDKIAAWKQEVFRVLQIFNTELAINTNVMVADIHRNILVGQGGASSRHQSTQVSVSLGGSLPPPPRVCFGRDELIKRVVELAESLQPIALVGAGGIGKTSIALSVLHHPRIKNKFGDNRRFIRCDQFLASCAHFLARLSNVIGAGVENPEDLTLLVPILTSKEMLIILDNAESTLDPQGTDAREIYAVVNELCQFETVCVCITSRITTVPTHCTRPEVSTVSMEAACEIFYRIYGGGGRSGIISNLLQRLDFHALSITLLATVASHNMWDHDRLAEEWDAHRARVLRTDYNESLAATIELSLASPTFCKLGPEARDLLEVIAFFPQGIDEKNLDWLFPIISDGKNIFDKFCVLSLTHRNNGFITMLTPIRNHFTPKDPKFSPLLCATKDRYFGQLSVKIYPDVPGFEDAQWIISEDVNVEHLLNIFTFIDAGSQDVLDGCDNFMTHLYWHKPRQTVLRSKIESLTDDHPSKPRCLFGLSWLFESVGNDTERKRLLTHSLRLEREKGGDIQVAFALQHLADANRELGLHGEGIQQVKEALEICERIDDIKEQLHCLNALAWLLLADDQLDTAEDTVSRMFDLFPEKGQEFLVFGSHHLLGHICYRKGEREKAVHHLEMTLGIASPFGWHYELFWVHYSLAGLFCDESKFDNANAHIERARLHTVDDTFCLGCLMELQAEVWYLQRRLEDAKSEALHALEIYEKLGAVLNVGFCKDLLRDIEQTMESWPVERNRPARW